MKVCVVGTGYVGLVAGTCFAETGNDVICLDSDASKIESLKKGLVPIYEPGLEGLIERNSSAGRLKFTTKYEDAIPGTEIIFLAVGTPGLPDGRPNLTYLKAAAETIGKHLTGPVLVVNKSTVPVGSHSIVGEWIRSQTRHAVEVVSNPEFMKEGSALDDFLKPDRVVIGTNSESAYLKMAELYAPFVRQGNPIFRMDPVSAELTKYASNAFLATRISFMNDLSRLCDVVGGDIEKIRLGMASDQRIGKHFLYSGVGYGGSCFPKDVQALVSTGKDNGVELFVANAAEETNATQKKYLFSKMKNVLGDKIRGMKVGIWGLAFKPNTDDMREAPSLVLIKELLAAGARVQAFDPIAMDVSRSILKDSIQFCSSAVEAANGVDALCIVTEWNEFRHFDLAKLGSSIPKAIFDGRNIFDPAKIKALGCQYYSIGRDSAVR